MDLNIRQIVDCFGSAGKAAKAAKGAGMDLKRQTIESWYDNETFPTWRTPEVLGLQDIAKHLPKPKRRKAA